MREGVHANVKATVITSCLVFAGWGLSWDLEGWGNTCLICERESAEVPLPELYVWDYSIWFICVCLDKRKEFHRPLLGPCRSWGFRVSSWLEDQKHIDTGAAQSLHLQCINTGWHVAMHVMAVSSDLTCSPWVSSPLRTSAEGRSQLDCGEHTKQSLTSAPRSVLPQFNNVVCADLPGAAAVLTYLKVVLPCSYCSHSYLSALFSPSIRITPGSAVLWLPPISASPSPHYVV